MLDEIDRRLVAALQVSARAPWGDLGKILGEHERTVARRVQRLITAGAIRITATYDDLRSGVGHPVHIRVRTDPGSVDTTARSLAARPDVRGVFAITGAADVWCELIASGDDHLRQLHEILANEVPAIPGVRATEAQVVLRTFTTVANWHAPLLSDAEVAGLRGLSPTPLPDLPDLVEFSSVEREVAELLIRDGRMSYTQIAEELGVSVPTARRKVASLLERRLVHLRVEAEPALLGLRVEVQLGLEVRPAGLDAVGSALARHPGVRYCAAIAGGRDLLVEVCLTHELELYRFITQVIGGLPDVVDVDMAFITRAYKRGHLLKDGRLTRSPDDVLRG
ncbi:Lrp/AsnC family transcriptional regulator [Sphaerisporangium sp. TRM90804]|uniref:Lrp/AsnC family transcriptional regulator n=1 Tax=Sphaerisporangium sp. TRM90804 TaxID=3031113 RepID=UPI00244ABC99|nr:Lrp/AsnC family transcriptional regulator [Sphaerisporangium sp. TRM90804]MDH2426783.1 Lrp/AsnC family transcriptional regulator [Sphaerisporangium sp. TRM90804]